MSETYETLMALPKEALASLLEKSFVELKNQSNRRENAEIRASAAEKELSRLRQKLEQLKVNQRETETELAIRMGYSFRAEKCSKEGRDLCSFEEYSKRFESN